MKEKKIENKKKVVAIVSGGMDSVTMLYDLIDRGYEVHVLSYIYGSKHNDKEIPMVVKNCEILKVKHIIIDLDLQKYFESSLLKDGEEIPEGHYADDNMKSTVVPFRNGIMLSFAVGYAENIEATEVYLGSHKGDRSQYPDCRTEFTAAMSEAAKLGTYNAVEIISPYNDVMKWDIVKRGIDLNVPYQNTWSCYNGREKPCLKCGTCIERIEAFKKAGITDAALTDEEWQQALKNLQELEK